LNTFKLYLATHTYLGIYKFGITILGKADKVLPLQYVCTKEEKQVWEHQCSGCRQEQRSSPLSCGEGQGERL